MHCPCCYRGKGVELFYHVEDLLSVEERRGVEAFVTKLELLCMLMAQYVGLEGVKFVWETLKVSRDAGGITYSAE